MQQLAAVQVALSLNADGARSLVVVELGILEPPSVPSHGIVRACRAHGSRLELHGGRRGNSRCRALLLAVWLLRHHLADNLLHAMHD